LRRRLGLVTMALEPETVLDRRYRETFEALLDELQARRRNDPNFTLDDVRGFLRDAYVYRGNDWVARGALFDVTQAARIAAYEVILAEWQEESS
jgi:hypothetical protein